MNHDKSIELYKAIKNSNERRVFEHWHASSISDCPRAHYYKRLGIAPLKQPSAALVIRWQAGHLLEEVIRPHVEAVWGKSASNERMTSDKLDLTGEFDNLILNGNRLVEIKSVHDMAFIERDGELFLKEQTGTKQWGQRIVKTWGKRDKPYLQHELQNHSYVLLLAEQGTQVEGIDYVYISLSGRIVVYSTQVQKDLLDNVRARLKVLNDAWATQTPPDCMCHLTEHPLYEGVLKYCDYRNEENSTCCSLKLVEDAVHERK